MGVSVSITDEREEIHALQSRSKVKSMKEEPKATIHSLHNNEERVIKYYPESSRASIPSNPEQ